MILVLVFDGLRLAVDTENGSKSILKMRGGSEIEWGKERMGEKAQSRRSATEIALFPIRFRYLLSF